MKRLTAHAIVLASLLLGGAIAYAELAHGPKDERAHPALERRGGSLLSVRGHTGNLYPGVAKRIKLQVTSRDRHPLELLSIRTRVGAAGTDCSGGNVHVGRFSGHLKIPPRGRRSVSVPISMSGEAGDPCQEGRFPLTFKARAGRP